MTVEESRIGAITEDLREELSFLIEDVGVGSVRLFSEGKLGPALVDELSRLGPHDVALLPLPADVLESVSRLLDYGRGRIDGGLRGVILTSEGGCECSLLRPRIYGAGWDPACGASIRWLDSSTPKLG